MGVGEKIAAGGDICEGSFNPTVRVLFVFCLFVCLWLFIGCCCCFFFFFFFFFFFVFFFFGGGGGGELFFNSSSSFSHLKYLRTVV